MGHHLPALLLRVQGYAQPAQPPVAAVLVGLVSERLMAANHMGQPVVSNINWDKSYFLTAVQVALLGLEGVSVNDKEESA